MKRTGMFLAILLAAAGTGIFAGGAQSQAGAGNAGGPVKLTVAITESLRIEDYETNVQTRLMEQATNTDLEFVLYPPADYLNKLNLMVMAGGNELQDIILARPGDAMVYQWAQEGAIIPLKKYYQNPALSANINDALKRAGYNFLPEITSPDGEIYGLPWVYQFYGEEMPMKFWYYKPWVDKLGLKLPATPEEFRSFLRALVTSDPNGNGKADEIGITGHFPSLIGNGGYRGWFNYLMNPFEYVSSQLYNLEKGVISVPYNTDGWKAGLKYIRSLIAEGLIPLENLTQDNNQVLTLLNADPVRVGTFTWSSTNGINASNPAGLQYISAPPLKGANGTRYATYIPSVANVAYLISANCKNPEAAFRVGDIMMREDISIGNRFGERGVNWDYPKDVPDATSRFATYMEGWAPKMVLYDDTGYWGGTSVANAAWRQQGAGCIAYDIHHGRLLRPEAMQGRQGNIAKAITMYNKTDFGPKEAVGKLIYTEEELAFVSEVQTTLNSYVLEMTSNFLAGNRDIDASWNAYVAELNAIGLPRVLSTVQKVYDRMYK
jgi:putative aldouronate transport system substrate-binding protein